MIGINRKKLIKQYENYEYLNQLLKPNPYNVHTLQKIQNKIAD